MDYLEGRVFILLVALCMLSSCFHDDYVCIFGSAHQIVKFKFKSTSFVLHLIHLDISFVFFSRTNIITKVTMQESVTSTVIVVQTKQRVRNDKWQNFHDKIYLSNLKL